MTTPGSATHGTALGARIPLRSRGARRRAGVRRPRSRFEEGNQMSVGNSRREFFGLAAATLAAASRH